MSSLLKRDEVVLGESMRQAQRCLEMMERRFRTNHTLQKAYCEFMEEYERLGHMTQITDADLTKAEDIYFIPHHAVSRPDSLTTKIRVVFNASAKTTLGTSLNDKLLLGPKILRSSFDIILKFRTHEYVITADVEKMFRQIKIEPRDRFLQCIVWRSNPNQSL